MSDEATTQMGAALKRCRRTIAIAAFAALASTALAACQPNAVPGEGCSPEGDFGVGSGWDGGNTYRCIEGQWVWSMTTHDAALAIKAVQDAKAAADAATPMPVPNAIPTDTTPPAVGACTNFPAGGRHLSYRWDGHLGPAHLMDSFDSPNCNGTVVNRYNVVDTSAIGPGSGFFIGVLVRCRNDYASVHAGALPDGWDMSFWEVVDSAGVHVGATGCRFTAAGTPVWPL